MPKIIRMIENTKFIELLQGHLIEKGLKVPSRRTCQEILRHLPAAAPKMCRGLNPAQEECIHEAFPNLKSLVVKLAQANGGISEEEKLNLLKCVNNAQTYMRSHFAYNIERQSNVASHCFLHACSDPENLEFSEQCEIEHTEKCFQCDNIFHIFEALGIAITNASNSGHSMDDCMEMKFDS